MIQLAFGPLTDVTRTRICQMIKPLCVAAITWLILQYSYTLRMIQR